MRFRSGDGHPRFAHLAPCAALTALGLSIGLAGRWVTQALLLSLVILAYLLIQPRLRVLVPRMLAPLVLLLGLPWPLPVVATLAASGIINGSLPGFLTPARPTLRAVVAGAAVGLPAGAVALLLVRTQITYFTFL